MRQTDCFFFHVILPIFRGTRGVDVRVLQRYRFPVYIYIL